MMTEPIEEWRVNQLQHASFMAMLVRSRGTSTEIRMLTKPPTFEILMEMGEAPHEVFLWSTLAHELDEARDMVRCHVQDVYTFAVDKHENMMNDRVVAWLNSGRYVKVNKPASRWGVMLESDKDIVTLNLTVAQIADLKRRMGSQTLSSEDRAFLNSLNLPDNPRVSYSVSKPSAMIRMMERWANWVNDQQANKEGRDRTQQRLTQNVNSTRSAKQNYLKFNGKRF